MNENLVIDSNFSNIPKSILGKIGKKLHLKRYHPIEIMKEHIYKYFVDNRIISCTNNIFEDFSPVVSTKQNFDDLLIGPEHPARSKSDTYYVDPDHVLRTHTSAHQTELLKRGLDDFLVVGDVYRKDEIDRCHYPVFHQIEGMLKVPDLFMGEPLDYLKKVLSGLVEHLFPGIDYYFNDDYFPFTEPSLEVCIGLNGEPDREKWMEILGCGVVRREILNNAGRSNNEQFVAFGLGLERLVMIAFQIPDIRYLWSEHERFLDQFKPKHEDSLCQINIFKPFSEIPSMHRDISFWIGFEDMRVIDENNSAMGNNGNNVWLKENDFYELVRENCGEWVEQIQCMDEFYHKKKNLYSRMYRMTYSPVDPNIKDFGVFTKLINKMQDEFRDILANSDLEVILR